MDCPKCLGKSTVGWRSIGENVLLCSRCGHEITSREYRREIEGDWGLYFASLPEEVTDQ